MTPRNALYLARSFFVQACSRYGAEYVRFVVKSLRISPGLLEGFITLAVEGRHFFIITRRFLRGRTAAEFGENGVRGDSKNYVRLRFKKVNAPPIRDLPDEKRITFTASFNFARSSSIAPVAAEFMGLDFTFFASCSIILKTSSTVAKSHFFVDIAPPPGVDPATAKSVGMESDAIDEKGPKQRSLSHLRIYSMPASSAGRLA